MPVPSLDPLTAGASRPRPVLLYAMASAGVSAFLGFTDIVDLVPHRVIQWVALAWAVVGVAWGLYVQSQVTPLSDPQAGDGTRLVRAPDAVPRTRRKGPPLPRLEWTDPNPGAGRNTDV